MSVPVVPRRTVVLPRRLRRSFAVGGALLATAGLSACGSSGNAATAAGSANAAAGAAAGPPAITLTATQMSCLEEAGVTLPTGGGRGGPGGGDGGTPPAGADGGTPPTGTPAAGGSGPGGGQSSAARTEMQAAMEACDVPVPTQPQGDAAPSGTDTTAPQATTPATTGAGATT